MPRIFDNIDLKLLPDLQQAMMDAHRADFCVGYFSARLEESGSIILTSGKAAKGIASVY